MFSSEVVNAVKHNQERKFLDESATQWEFQTTTEVLSL
jgi:hypothetical protein